MIHYYQVMNGIGASDQPIPSCEPISLPATIEDHQPLYWLMNDEPASRQVCSRLHHPAHRNHDLHATELLRSNGAPELDEPLPQWIAELINQRRVLAVNTGHPRWKERLAIKPGNGRRVHLAGLGDVGGLLLTGLRLLGKNSIDQIGIYDLSSEKISRWELEGNQIASLECHQYPVVTPLTEDRLFDCDLFVFCVAQEIPDPLPEHMDIRMAQLKGNQKIVRDYARKARDANFSGLFAVVSDPVDQLCQAAFWESNQDETGQLDYQGLFPEQIKGYGLGVMNARAHYYASAHQDLAHFREEGRLFGPHGRGLIVADRLKGYHPTLSQWLTEKTEKANLAVRSTGYKPYVAPALSSGALPLLATLRGEWHYSTIYLNRVYFGCLNRLDSLGQEWEVPEIPASLFQRIQETYQQLEGSPCSSC